MALSTYAELQTSITSWLNRADLTSQIPDFIALAEARFNRDLRVPQMINRDTAEVTSGYVSLPADFLELITLRVQGSNQYEAMEFISNEAYFDYLNDGITGETRYYTIIGDKIQLLPEPGAGNPITLELIYTEKIPSLSNSNTTNWLLTKAPDLYLVQSMLAAEVYLMNDERVPQWQAFATGTIEAMNKEGERAKYSRGALKMKKKTFG
jgi:hypothetical protein